MRRFLFLAVLVAGCGTESAYGQPAWTMPGQDAAAETSEIDAADAGVDTGHDASDSRADVADSRADSAVDAPQGTLARICEPGRQEACACVGGALGAQRCADDGMVWGECLCPDAASDSAIDAVADTAADAQADSAADAPVDTGMDSGSVVDSGADAVAECGAFQILEQPTACEGEYGQDGSGLVYDKNTKLLWTAKTKFIKDGKWPHYSEYCKSIGMTLPTADQAKTLIASCAIPCHWVTWTTTAAESKPWVHYHVNWMGDMSPLDFGDGTIRALCVKP